ncbi:MAG: hypothetical protein KDB77_06010, partial [Flavobacteriales bacterium]|nr:hypothetical protein [Flavobacteriales bacterium]
GNTEDVETSVASVIFEMLATDDIQLDEELLQAVYLDYRRRHNLGEAVDGSTYARHEEATWRDLAIDLLSERHALSPNWREKHRIYTTREREVLLDAIEEAIILLKERRVDRLILERQDELKEAGNEEDQLLVLQQIVKLNLVKQEFAKRTGRVVVG